MLSLSGRRRPKANHARCALVLLAALCSACDGQTSAAEPRPALWEVTGPDGATGYVFGTVHALPYGLEWQTPAIDRAVQRSGMLVLEIVDPADAGAARAAFERLGTTPGQPPLAARVAPGLRDELRAALAETRLTPQRFAALEDWAAALTLSFALEASDGYDPENGADRALLKLAGKRPVVGLETLEGQLGLFDALSPREQRALLEAVVAEAGDEADSLRLIQAWAQGDIAALDREAHDGMLADPRLRETLLVARNRAWAKQAAALLRAGKRPFVAVGAAHVVGSDGLPALLGAQGFELKRVQ